MNTNAPTKATEGKTDRVKLLPAVGFALPMVGMTWSGPRGPLRQRQAETENALAALSESVLLVSA